MKLRKIVGRSWCAALFVSFVAMCSSCVSTPPPPPVTPVPPVVVDQDECQAACDNLNKLNCEDGKDIETHTRCLINAECGVGQTCSPKGQCIAPCVTFCRDTEEQGVWLDPGCVATITACDQIDDCPMSMPKAASASKRSCDDETCQIDL